MPNNGANDCRKKDVGRECQGESLSDQRNKRGEIQKASIEGNAGQSGEESTEIFGRGAYFTVDLAHHN